MAFQAKSARLESIASDGNALERVLSGLKFQRREATPASKRASVEPSAPGEVDVLVPRGWAFA